MRSATGVLLPIHAILVPQGSEYQAICRGLTRIVPTPPVVPIPIGSEPLTRHLKKLQQAGYFSNHQQPRVLLMGLCGSLTPRYSIGDIVLYQACVYSSKAAPSPLHPCDPTLTTRILERLKERAYLVRALTSDRIVWSAAEKRHLGQSYDAEVVDMEGFAALEVLSQAGVAVAMLRVVSDDCEHDLPDLTSALSPDGSLQRLPLAIGLLRQPLAATRLIRGALRGLQVLQEVTAFLFAE